MKIHEFLIAFFIFTLFVTVIVISEGILPAEKSTSKDVVAACDSDLQCWGNRAIIVGAWQCKKSIEKEAVADIRWTDSFGHPLFMQLAWNNRGAKTITLIGDELLFQNRFGAYIRMTYSCVVDVIGQKVLAHYVREGRLPELKAKPALSN